MEGIIEQIKDKVKNCDETSKEGRARKGAYIDCITMIKEIRQCSDSDRNAVLADGWRDVHKELPEYTTQAWGYRFAIVIVCVNGMVMEGKWEEGKWSVLNGIEIDNDKVTHWQPLPPPPTVS